ncbi:MAG TPA: AAA family ATPase, partial [Stenomitos sp.]
MTEDRRCLPEPGQMLLLSAGPGTGKTWTLRRWRHALALPTVYLRLTPEDRDPAVLGHRLIRLLAEHLPESTSRLRGDLAWGSTLCALLPSVAVLLDDWHALEGSEAVIQLAAFLWGLPAGSIVAVASRHRFDDSLALAAEAWPLDDPSRPEQPQPEDLATLPERLRDWTLAMALVGEAPRSAESLELVRRNVAFETREGRVALRPAWACLAGETRPAFATEATWDAVGTLIEAFAERHRWTERHAEIASLLAQVPREVRDRRPALLSLEGQQL